MNDAPSASITIKKYANRRLYNTATSTYVTLDHLAQMVKQGIEFNVYDAKTSEDITRSVLTQIIVEEEGKAGQNLLPIGFLRQLIGFYGDNMQWLVPKYLEQSMAMLTKNQEQLRGYFQKAFGGMFPFGSTLEQMSKQNLAMFERAMRMFSPFGAAEGLMNAKGMGAEAGSNAADEQEKAEEAAFTPSATITPMPGSMHASMLAPMPTSATNQASAMPPASGEEVQSKIAALQRQLADLAKNKA